MGAVRIVILVVAAAAAIGLALVVRQMAAHRPAAVVTRLEAAPTVEVLTARRDLPIGAHIAQADLVWRSFPATAVSPAWITTRAAPPSGGLHIGPPAAHAAASPDGAMQQVVGAFVHQPIFEGEPILEREIVRGGSGSYMSLALQPGMRAVALPVTAETGAGGFILPGDHVDVILTRKASAVGGGGPGDQAASVAETILSDVRVLGVDQQSQPKPGSDAIVAASVTLEVPAGEVESLLAAKARGDLALDLRSYADTTASSGRPGGSSGSVRFVRAGQVSEVSAP